MSVNIHEQGRLPRISLPSGPFIKKMARSILSSEKIRVRRIGGLAEINIIFVDNARIRKLNRSFLREKSETDVIAFGYPSGADIFISVPVAVFNAKRFNQPPRREIIRLVVHGLLHVLGYDDLKPSLKKVMWSKQEKFVQKFFPISQ